MIAFEKVHLLHQPFIFKWLKEPHVKEWWDNSPEHKADIPNFMQGRSQLSSYFEGRYTYWIGFIHNIPYSLIMTIEELPHEDRPPLKRQHLSLTGSTYSLDFMIGAKEFLGQGFARPTLEQFILFFQRA